MKPKKPLRILYVENDSMAQNIFQLVHEAAGFDESSLEMVADGNEALKQMTKNRYDIVFLDIGLPPPGGMELAKEIRAKDGLNKNVPIVALTCHSGKSYQETVKKCGMQEFITKPITIKGYLEMLEKYLPKEKSSAA